MIKIIYEISKEHYNELEKENWFGCGSCEDYLRELINDNPCDVCNAPLIIKIKENN